MIFIVFFVIAIASLFGFGQVMGMHKREKNVASSMYDRAQETKKNFLERITTFSTHQKKRKWYQFWLPKQPKKSFIEKIFDIGDQEK